MTYKEIFCFLMNTDLFHLSIFSLIIDFFGECITRLTHLEQWVSQVKQEVLSLPEHPGRQKSSNFCCEFPFA